jgi:hypothetical protein
VARTGVRYDAWAKAHPLQVEEEKAPGREVFRFAHHRPTGASKRPFSGQVGDPVTTEKGQEPCQGVSAWDEPCTQPATRYCKECGRWFCDAHFTDPDWLPCAGE